MVISNNLDFFLIEFGMNSVFRALSSDPIDNNGKPAGKGGLGGHLNLADLGEAAGATGTKKCVEFNILDEFMDGTSLQTPVQCQSPTGLGLGSTGGKGMAAAKAAGDLAAKSILKAANPLAQDKRDDKGVKDQHGMASTGSVTGSNGTTEPGTGIGQRRVNTSGRHQGSSSCSEGGCCKFILLVLALCGVVFFIAMCENGNCVDSRAIALSGHYSSPISPTRTAKKKPQKQRKISDIWKGCETRGGLTLNCMTARYQNVTKQRDLLTTELVQRVKDNEYYNIQQLGLNQTILKIRLNQTQVVLQNALINYENFKDYTEHRLRQAANNLTYLDGRLNITEKYLLTLLKTHEGNVRRLFVNQLRSLDLLDSIHQNLAELNDEFDRRNGESQSNKVCQVGFIFVAATHFIAAAAGLNSA